MRLHSLHATAFGPFAETVEVDFDDLSEAGVFLLTGPTGAGKSSVLDAVCFGLYGQVPGDRQDARHLRSDQAPPEMAPEVVLEVSIGDRRLRFTRSPAWERPKRRGTGTVREQAHVVVQERSSEGWRGLTNRLDEAGDLVTSLLGMNLDQFTQVALLPQGRFMSFLRSRSSERHALLQQLFRTRRFEDVERWLAQRRVELHREVRQAHDHTSSTLSRLLEAAAAPLPEGWDVHDLDPVAHQIAGWAQQRLDDAGRTARTTAATATTTAAAQQRTAADLAEAEARSATRVRAASAAARLADLERTRPDHLGRQQRLARHQQAAPVLPAARRAREAAEQAESARQRATAAASTAARTLRLELSEDVDELLEPLDRARTGLVTARELAARFLPREAELTRVEGECRNRERELARLAGRHREVVGGLLTLPDRRTALEERISAAREAAATVAARAARTTALEQQLEDLKHLAGQRTELAAVEEECARTAASVLDLREAYLNAREARIEGMAAELATALVVGGACPVCGSADHPDPARSGAAATGREVEDAARKALEEGQFEQQLREARLAELKAQVKALALRVGEAVAAEVERDLAAARDDLEQARARAADLAALDDELVVLVAAAAEAEAEAHRIEVAQASLRAEQEAGRARLEELAGELAGVLEDDGVDTLAELIARHDQHARQLEEAVAALREHQLASATATEAHDAARHTARHAGFDSPTEALAAALDDDSAAALAADIEAFLDDERECRAILDDADVVAVLDRPEDDLADLRTRAGEAAEAHERALVATRAADHRHHRLTELVAELEVRRAEWEPLRHRHAEVASLAALVEGKGADNPLKMRLSAYVLGERLRLVVDSANERLRRMTGHRYTLAHSDDRGAGEQRGGLSLRVVDDWTGRSRDPATLSGGETFVVSLALALGLADTVSHEAGGTDVDTFFVDEGFGSLDAETLDDVLDTLDRLRDGGRVVGVVSHVAEMRSRITTRLEVHKGRTGSTVRAVHAVG